MSYVRNKFPEIKTSAKSKTPAKLRNIKSKYSQNNLQNYSKNLKENEKNNKEKTPEKNINKKIINIVDVSQRHYWNKSPKQNSNIGKK